MPHPPQEEQSRPATKGASNRSIGEPIAWGPLVGLGTDYPHDELRERGAECDAAAPTFQEQILGSPLLLYSASLLTIRNSASPQGGLLRMPCRQRCLFCYRRLRRTWAAAFCRDWPSRGLGMAVASLYIGSLGPCFASTPRRQGTSLPPPPRTPRMSETVALPPDASARLAMLAEMLKRSSSSDAEEASRRETSRSDAPARKSK
jgi:hypothetical protein